jgi:predicted DCC family thiol-disulfide oxidoreductase YuxK
MTPEKLILFDGVCNLCCIWVNMLIKLDKTEKFTFASLQLERANEFLEPLSIKANKTETIIYIKGDKFWVESSAILEILKDLSGIWKVFIVFQLIPKTIRDSLYRYIALNRYKLFGKRNICMLPTTENQKRFLT